PREATRVTAWRTATYMPETRTGNRPVRRLPDGARPRQGLRRAPRAIPPGGHDGVTDAPHRCRSAVARVPGHDGSAGCVLRPDLRAVVGDPPVHPRAQPDRTAAGGPRPVRDGRPGGPPRLAASQLHAARAGPLVPVCRPGDR